MCGIAAAFSYDDSAGPVDRDELRLSSEQMRARGPDGEGEWFSDDRRIGFIHRRLSIIDLSPAGLQPMLSNDSSLAIVFNGEIYNYKELRQSLLNQGRQLRSHSDTEVLLELYALRGADMVRELRGMFAFALWDRNKQGLLVARDPFGIKPLYYCDDGVIFRIASQVKALLAGGGIDTTPAPAGHVGFFLWGHVPEPYTLYKGIRSLPAGTTMWVDRNGASAPAFFCRTTEILAQAAENNQATSISRESLRNALSETVRYHLVADVPVGVFLSSGLDSTMITSLAAGHGGDLRSVTLGFDEYRGTAADETPLAEQFADGCGANHQTIWVSRENFHAQRDRVFDAMDQPSVDGINTYFVSLAAREAGLKVALSGLGGDEVFGSYDTFRDVPWMVRLTRPVASVLPRFGRRFRVVTRPVLSRLTSPKYAGLFEFGSTYGGAYLLRRGMFMPWELPELLEPEMVRQGWQELQTVARLDDTVERVGKPRLKVSALELNWYMRNQLLRDSDWAGMAHSVEIRVPFVDVSFLRQIAPFIAAPQPMTKRQVAATASELITPELLERPKSGFQIPVREWLLNSETSDGAPAFERGLRGWAQQVYQRFSGESVPRLPRGRRSR